MNNLPVFVKCNGTMDDMEGRDDLEGMEEVVVDESEDILIDDNASVWTDAEEDNVEEVIEPTIDEPVPQAVHDDSIFVFRTHTDSVYCSAFHPTCHDLVLTGGGDDVAYLWNYPTTMNITTRKVVRLEGHSDTITSVGFNFDGSLCLTGAYDGQVRIWDSNSGELKQILEGPEDIEFACWHSKGNAVLAGSKDGTVWLWLAHDGTCLQVLAGHDGGVSCGVFSRDGKNILTGGEDGTIFITHVYPFSSHSVIGTVRIWSPKTGVCKHVFSSHDGHDGTVTCIDGSEDGETVLTGE